MPAQYQKKSLKTVPSLAMSFFNDCFYIALHLLTLGLQYQDRLPQDKTGTFTLVDLVPLFRQLGEKQYREQLTIQRSVLLEILQEARGLGDTHLRSRYAEVERSLKRVMHHLTHLSRVWKDVLPRHIYLRAIGSLLDGVLEHLTLQFEKLQDISEEETHHLHKLLSAFFDCSFFFSPRSAAERRADREAEEEEIEKERRQDMTKRYAHSWSKFVKMVNILDSKLVVIVDAYVKGLMPEFKAEELKAIICALFSDSPLRKSQLVLVK